MRAYLIISLKWAITLLLSYCIYHTTDNTYIPVALLWVMGWQQMRDVILGNTILEQERQDTIINALIIVTEQHWAITEHIIDRLSKGKHGTVQ